MKKLLLGSTAALALVAAASPANALSCQGNVCFGTATEWSATGPLAFDLIGVVTDTNCAFYAEAGNPYSAKVKSCTPYIHNVTATTDPTTGDDANDGYRPGSLWLNSTDNGVFLMSDATVGAAVWQDLAQSGGGLTAVADDPAPSLGGDLIAQDPYNICFNLPDVSGEYEGCVGVGAEGQVDFNGDVFDLNFDTIAFRSGGSIYLKSSGAFDNAELRIGTGVVLNGETVYPIQFVTPPTPAHQQTSSDAGPTAAITNAGVGTLIGVIPSFLSDFDYAPGAYVELTSIINKANTRDGTIWIRFTVNGTPVGSDFPFNVPGSGATSPLSLTTTIEAGNLPANGDALEVLVWGDTGNHSQFSVTLTDSTVLIQQPGAGGGGGGVDLGTARTLTTVTITNTGGNNAVINQADDTNAGVITGPEHEKLGDIEPLADVTDVANVTAAGAIMSTGTNGYVLTQFSETARFTPPATACQAMEVTITGGSGNFTLDAPTGTAPPDYYQCVYSVKNQSGGPRTVVFGTVNTAAGQRLPQFDMLDGTTVSEIVLYTLNQGVDWYYDGGNLDMTSLPENATPDGADLVICQDVSDDPDQWKRCPISALGVGGGVDSITANAPINADQSTGDVTLSLDPLTNSDIGGNSNFITGNVSVTAADHGRTIVCNSASDLTITVNGGTPVWSPDYHLYVSNANTGNCEVVTGTATVRVSTGFTANFPQYSGGTIMGLDSIQVIVTGGAAQ